MASLLFFRRFIAMRGDMAGAADFLKSGHKFQRRACSGAPGPDVCSSLIYMIFPGAGRVSGEMGRISISNDCRDYGIQTHGWAGTPEPITFA